VVVTFKRGAFYGDFKNQTPRWHLAKEDGGKWGTYVAWCGYTRSNILGELQISRSKTPKKDSETCQKCLTALAKAEAQAIKEARARK
jgi:hypothetical protein